MSFWYSMLGDGVGGLKINMTDWDSSGFPETQLWEKSGKQGTKWMYAQVELKSKGNYSVLSYFNMIFIFYCYVIYDQPNFDPVS